MKNKTVHMMGICGTAMGSLAGLLKDMGYNVRGSDQNVYPPMSTKLQEMGIKISEGYRPENLEPRPDMVIVGNVMSRTHSEVQALLNTDIPYMSLPEAMGKFLIQDRHSIVISGTHGKTTTTALMAWVTEQMNLQPGFLIGGVPLNFSNSFAVGKGNYFVIEGDEYDTAFFDKVPKFVHYRPQSVVLTSIEFDHADIYKDLDAVLAAFEKLMVLMPKGGHLVYNGDDINIPKVLDKAQCHKISYGVTKGDYQLGDIKWGEMYSEFDVIYKGKKKTTLKTQLFGEYNLLNVLAVYALTQELGWDDAKVRDAIAGYKGVKRRQEIFGRPQGITLIDDFAHHPTAVKVTIDGVRKRFPKSRIIGVFEPRSATSRRKIFQDDFAKSLATADVVILSEPFDQSKIQEGDRMNIEDVVKSCAQLRGEKNVFLGHNTDELVGMIKKSVKPGDVVLLMSNGGFGGIYQKLLSALS